MYMAIMSVFVGGFTIKAKEQNQHRIRVTVCDLGVLSRKHLDFLSCLKMFNLSSERPLLARHHVIRDSDMSPGVNHSRVFAPLCIEQHTQYYWAYALGWTSLCLRVWPSLKLTQILCLWKILLNIFNRHATYGMAMFLHFSFSALGVSLWCLLDDLTKVHFGWPHVRSTVSMCVSSFCFPSDGGSLLGLVL